MKSFYYVCQKSILTPHFDHIFRKTSQTQKNLKTIFFFNVIRSIFIYFIIFKLYVYHFYTTRFSKTKILRKLKRNKN
jgi:hypothetical protein